MWVQQVLMWENAGHHGCQHKKMLISDGLKQSSNAFPHPKYSVEIAKDFDQSCYGLICYYGFSI